jgi:hypothetical protein
LKCFKRQWLDWGQYFISDRKKRLYFYWGLVAAGLILMAIAGVMAE